MGIQATTPTETATESQPRKPTLLIVDDETGPRESLRMVFRDRFNCVVATCGREGIEYAREHTVDAAVLDIKMPDMSGVDVLREIKRFDPHTECIMLTGYETLETARAALRFGATDYLNKPFDVFSMRQLIDECISRRRRRLEADATLASLQEINQELAHELAQSNRAVSAGVISAGVVHELNNPLSIIAGYVQLLERDVEQIRSGNEDAAQHIAHRLVTIQREIERCKDIARRFLNFSRTRQNAVELVEVGKLLDDTAALVKAHPANHGIETRCVVSHPDLHLCGHGAELLQVLLNLAVNSVQAMNGKGELRLDAEAIAKAPEHTVFHSTTFDPEAPLLKITVTDTGCGITPADLAKIFRPYFTTKTEGTGLGLSIVAELVATYKGAIDVQSVPGQGTAVALFLPRVA